MNEILKINKTKISFQKQWYIINVNKHYIALHTERQSKLFIYIYKGSTQKLFTTVIYHIGSQ